MNACRMLEVLSLPLRMVAGRVSPPASARTPSLGVQTNRAGGVVNGASLAVLLLLGAVLLSATPALAQNPIVSNLKETMQENSVSAPVATAFTTGSRASGYTLTAAVVGFYAGSSIAVHIYDASGNVPGSSIGALVGPTNVSAIGDYTFTSSGGITLAASTTYYLFVEGSNRYRTTVSTDQTATDDWGIGTGILFLSGGTWFSTGLVFSTQVLHFSLSVRNPPPLGFRGKTIANQTYTAGTPITDLTLPTVTSGGGNLSYMLEPDPPAGLSFNSSNRALSGTPTTAMAESAYTYTATDAAGAGATLDFTIRVLPAVTFRLTAAAVSGDSSGFVTGAGQTLTGSVTPANVPNGHTAVYQWYRGVEASGNGGFVVSSGSNIYTTVNDDRGYRLGFGVHYRRTSDDAVSPQIRTAPVGVRPAPWNRGQLISVDDTAMVGQRPSLTVSREPHSGFRVLLQIQRRPGSSGNSWVTVAENRGAAVTYTLTEGDSGYSFQFCAIHEAIAPRVINSEPLCFPVDNGTVVPAVNVKIRLRVFLEGPLE